jgi:hypothetical protein
MGVDSKVELSEFTFGMCEDMTPIYKRLLSEV